MIGQPDGVTGRRPGGRQRPGVAPGRPAERRGRAPCGRGPDERTF